MISSERAVGPAKKSSWKDPGISEGQAASDKDEVAKKLADKHFDIEPGISRIFKLRGKSALGLLIDRIANGPAEPKRSRAWISAAAA